MTVIGGIAYPAQHRRSPNANGGLTFDPSLSLPPPHPTPTLLSPPQFTFDPGIEAQRRQAQRGLEDTEADVRKNRKWEGTDWRLKKRQITTDTKRGRQSLATDRSRGEEDLNTKEGELQRDAQRSREDFQTRLNEIGRQFGELAHRQGEAQNASGVLDQGTSAAAAAARARNQQTAEAPIHTAQQRLEEDLLSALTRVGTSRSRLEEDYGTKLSQLTQDRNMKRLLTNIQHGRSMFDLKTELQRARREGAITDVDLLEQEIWQAKENHPGAFKKWAAANPDFMATIQGSSAGGGQAGGALPAIGHNVVAPPPKKKQKKGRR